MDQNNELHDINKKLNKMLMLLQGNDLDRKDTGIVGQLDDQGERLARLEKFKDRAVYIFIGMAAPASWGIIQMLITLFVKK